jgi:hypothetical protein
MQSSVRCKPLQCDEIGRPHVASTDEGLMPKRRHRNPHIRKMIRTTLLILSRVQAVFNAVLSILIKAGQAGVSILTILLIAKQLGWW